MGSVVEDRRAAGTEGLGDAGTARRVDARCWDCLGFAFPAFASLPFAFSLSAANFFWAVPRLCALVYDPCCLAREIQKISTLF
jgi:hypothetical protein